jgi:DNA-binding NarL/FixJ family response regulator
VIQSPCEISNNKVSMLPSFDIFKVESNGLRWVEAAVDLERATARVKALAASSPGEYIILDQNTGEKISIKPPTRRIVFQIGYDEKGLNARAELLRRFGHEVISVTHNEAAKVALRSYRAVDVFIVGHTAPEQTRAEMAAWLKANYPKVKVVALNPSRNQLPGADYNVVLNVHDEWLSLLAAAAG